MKPWMMQQGDNGEPEYIGFAKSHDDMLDKMVKSHASDSIGKETYINELDKDTYEYIKKDLSDDEVKELDNYFKECLKEEKYYSDKVIGKYTTKNGKSVKLKRTDGRNLYSIGAKPYLVYNDIILTPEDIKDFDKIEIKDNQIDCPSTRWINIIKDGTIDAILDSKDEHKTR